jgi:enamine deaminase RidA (YjgF/YER057c/UK114 family)
MNARSIALFCALLAASAAAQPASPAWAANAAAEVTRTYRAPDAPIAATATVPPGFETIYFSGMMADLPPVAADGKAPPAGDAEAQALSVFTKIGAALKAQGLSEADVVSMTIFMKGGPDGAPMDFKGMMKSYRKFYGTPAQPHRPTRSTVQVAGLAAPNALLEVEVTAVRRIGR